MTAEITFDPIAAVAALGRSGYTLTIHRMTVSGRTRPDAYGYGAWNSTRTWPTLPGRPSHSSVGSSSGVVKPDLPGVIWSVGDGEQPDAPVPEYDWYDPYYPWRSGWDQRPMTGVYGRSGRESRCDDGRVFVLAHILLPEGYAEDVVLEYRPAPQETTR